MEDLNLAAYLGTFWIVLLLVAFYTVDSAPVHLVGASC